MTRATRRSGMVLALLGLAGALFFWLTDPRLGPEGRRDPQGQGVRHWLYRLRGSSDNPVDAANTAWLGTTVGIVGSAAVLATGVWLLTRKAV